MIRIIKKDIVRWEAMCKPNQTEGDLEIKNILEWNKAAIRRHIWELLADQFSLWALWIIKTKMKLLSF